ncbi:hypothetical protein BU107_05870 [Staphylococcus xylosus]|uniref:hypothetical protein n=1 Tax=Staphylococcus xylosus TaxID=1288 RepID=UPI000E690C7B|nr:hypothetical protein [Staphylococcus xylosus]RIM88327.1 hypothetical protein BU107_05870 [Staphylococcus xylosus]
MNILEEIKDVIQNDNLLSKLVGDRVYFYKLTENADDTDSFVIISPLYDTPSTFVSNKYLSVRFSVQIDVESYDNQTAIDIKNRIRHLMWQMGMEQFSTQLDDYFEETKRYVMSRRYRGIPKNKYYKGERVE